MNNKIKSYAYTGTERSKAIFQIYVNTTMADYDRKFPPISYEYDNYGLDELSIFAKKDKSALDELINRLNSWLKAYAYKSAQEMNLDYSELYISMLKICKEAVKKYDPAVGAFVRLLRKMLFYGIIRFRYRKAQQYILDLKTFGRRVGMKNESAFCESEFNADNPVDHIIEKVDIQFFLNPRPMIDREIFQLYLESNTIRYISKTLQIPYSTVKYRLYNMLKDYRKQVYGMIDKE